jgi:transcriptional regulator with XRE-family HTH domain
METKWQGGTSFMKTRKLALGTRNIIGARVTEARLRQGLKQNELLAKLQVEGIEISIPALSLLEGQKRPVFDFELVALARVLNVSVSWLLGLE